MTLIELEGHSNISSLIINSINSKVINNSEVTTETITSTPSPSSELSQETTE